jgi:hypothetical protein
MALAWPEAAINVPLDQSLVTRASLANGEGDRIRLEEAWWVS